MRENLKMLNHKQAGFTLIEILTALLIVGILGSIAVSSYSNSVIAASRSDARTSLQDLATALEKCKLLYGAYNSANCGTGNGDTVPSTEGLYDIKVVSAASTFTLTAAPSTGSKQTKDTDCTSLILNQLGQKSGTGANTDTCW
jgi:type IV pilus assembly protein PilE